MAKINNSLISVGDLVVGRKCFKNDYEGLKGIVIGDCKSNFVIAGHLSVKWKDGVNAIVGRRTLILKQKNFVPKRILEFIQD